MSSSGQFAARARALDALELSRASPLLAHAAQTAASARAAELEARTARVSARLRARIASGRYTREGLRQVFRALATAEAPESGTIPHYGLGDSLLAGLLHPGEPEPETRAIEPELVFYQPSPVHVIVSLFERAELGPGDQICDLGSGLGHVLILARLLFGARALGVEREPAYFEHAQRSIRALCLNGIELLCADAREADFGASNVFFLYTPFRGAVLGQVMKRLREQARTRHLRVCCSGPCSQMITREDWLVRCGPPWESEAGELLVLESAANPAL